MRVLISLFTAFVIALTPLVAAAQQPVSADVETMALRTMANGIPLGSRVRVETREGRRMTATLMAVNDDGIVVKRESRRPEPAVAIAYSDLTHLRRDERTGFTAAKAIGIGLAAGVGAILTLFGIAVAISD